MGENAMFNLPLPGGLQMATITPGLARYFGADTGVLVVGGVGMDGDGLQDGDVIVRIAGEPVRNVEDVLPRLMKPGSEERIELQVMREHSLQTVRAAPLPPPHMFFHHLQEPN